MQGPPEVRSPAGLVGSPTVTPQAVMPPGERKLAHFHVGTDGNCCECDHDAGKPHESPIGSQEPFVATQDATEVLRLGIGALDDPALGAARPVHL
jgi:hypothetical protein